jgi:diguanylate cyclase (GGDEF)-like protein
MVTVIDCIIHKHNIWLVIVAVVICITGSWVTARLFLRAVTVNGLQRAGWYFLTALASGVAIWCTHFIAMLGFDPGVPVGFELTLTNLSLFVAIGGSAMGFVIAGSHLSRVAPALGGAVVGLSIAAMHYIGMTAYRVDGVVSWDMTYLVASILLSIGLSAVALHVAMRPGLHAGNIMAGTLAFAIMAMHFTGMTAIHIAPAPVGGTFSDPDVLHALALAVTGMALLVVGAGLVSYLIDDSARAEAVERLRIMAMNDALTGLPNRASFNDRLDHEIKLASDSKRKLALIGIDLNRFKEINDLRGHNAGDEVLRVLGRRMKGLLRDDASEFVARMGGDEFAALCRTDDKASLSDFLARLETALFKPIRIEGFDVVPGASLGVALWPDDAADKVTLVSNADLAMYRAKASPTHKICFYEPSMDETIKARRCLASDLREALARGQLSLHYQVQTSVSTGEIRGYEALARWEHPEHGFIPPAEFIPVAEENGLIFPIGEWVLREACTAAASFDPRYKVAVNLSAAQLTRADLPGIIMKTLVETGLPAHRLEVELTESTIFTDKERAIHVLRQIKAIGVGVALDDFGTGYSSLDTLRSFPFDKIKLDRSFMSECNPQGKAIVRAVLALGKSLDIPVLAEGIETEEQLTMLKTEGCDEAQGFLLGHPVPLDDIVVSARIMPICRNNRKDPPRDAAPETAKAATAGRGRA